MTTITWIILGVVGLLVIWFIAAYNSFVKLRNRTEEAESDIEVQLKRRFDLIPNLLESVKGYMGHERGVLEAVTKARTEALGSQNVKDKTKADNMLTGALKTLFAVAESYPDLKANTNFLELQQELSDTENKIQASRRFFNTNVRDLNTAIESFPSNIIAKLFNFKKKEFFDLEEEAAKQPVKVKF